MYVLKVAMLAEPLEKLRKMTWLFLTVTVLIRK
jgi:hypothetical protein